MTITARHALVTGGSRGIGRGITLKLADHGVYVAINYLKDEASAKATLEQVRSRGADGFTVQADVSQPAQVERLFSRVRSEFGSLDIFVANARPEVGAFYQPPTSIGLDQWDAAMSSQATAFLIGAREAEKLMPDNGRIVAITYAPGGRYGSWQAWVGMGAAKSALETLCPLLRGGARTARHHRQHHQPRMDRRQRAQHPAGSGRADDPRPPQERMDADAAAGHAGGHRQRRHAALLERGGLDYGSAHRRGRRDGADGSRTASRDSTAGAAGAGRVAVPTDCDGWPRDVRTQMRQEVAAKVLPRLRQ